MGRGRVAPPAKGTQVQEVTVKAEVPARLRPAGGALRRFGRNGIGLAAVLVAATIVQACPAAQSALEFDRGGIAAGQWWRLASCNLVHFGWFNFAANVGAFAALCFVARRRGVNVTPVVLPAAALVGAAVYLWADGVSVYRGLSGVSYALLAMLVLHAAWRAGKAAAAAWIGVLALAAARSAFEAATGRSLLPTSLPAGAGVAPVSHLAGLATGAAVVVGGTILTWAARIRPVRASRESARGRSPGSGPAASSARRAVFPP